MKILHFLLICTWATLSVNRCYGSAVYGSPYYPIKIEDLTDGDIKEIEYWDEYYHRPKRSGSPSGSGDIVTQLKSAVVSGLKQKIGQVAKASAGAVAGASAGASKGSAAGSAGEAKGHDTYGPPPVEKPFNLWELKKSVLNTLLQAVKAIQGGVLAIKGQLIKGSGYLVSGGGKLLAAGGDKVTELGKNIIHNSVLVPPSKTHPWHSETYGAPASYSAPSGPSEVYDSPPPSAIGPSYIPESSYEGHYDFNDVKLHHPSDGLIILRRIAPNKDKYSSQSKSSDVGGASPSASIGSTAHAGVSNLVGKILGLSSLEKPNNIAKEPAYDSKGNQYTPEDSHTGFSPPSPPHYEAQSALASPSPLPAQPSGQQSTGNVDFTFTNTHLNTVSNNIPFGGDLASQPAAYGTDGAFGGYQDYMGTQASNKYESKVKFTRGELQDTVASSQIQLPNDAPQSLEALKALLEQEKTNDHHPAPIYHYKAPEAAPSASILDPGLASLANFLPTESSRVIMNYKDSVRDYTKLKTYPSTKIRASSHSGRYKTTPSKKRKRTSQEIRYTRPTKSDYEVIKSISYKLTPGGPKRLT
ncbi:uncharacterized protein LOC143194996 isoform X2 [Rhynchophorus ferrugineus]|uniref:uncharacterized protein LOC143194996 isoform X2 n=1 Tax=Rhynchophorus ferrugineus TaxID=354439 RepID=UPI003FCC3B90